MEEGGNSSTAEEADEEVAVEDVDEERMDGEKSGTAVLLGGRGSTCWRWCPKVHIFTRTCNLEVVPKRQIYKNYKELSLPAAKMLQIITFHCIAHITLAYYQL